MAIDFGPMPDFNVKQPPPFDPLAFKQKQATLAGLLSENALRSQLAPLNVQEAQGRVEAQNLDIELKKIQLQGQQGLTKWLQEGDTNEEVPADKFSLNDKIATFVGVDPKDPIMGVVRSMAQHGVPAQVLMVEAQGMLQRRNEYAKGTEEQQKIIKENYDVWKDAMGTIFNADPKNYSLLTSQALPRLQQATHLSPELDMAVNMLRQDPNSAVPMVYNMVAAQDKALGLSKTAAEAAKNRYEAANLAAKTDPNSPLYDPSAAYLAKRAAAGDPEAKAILGQQAKQAGAKSAAEAAGRFPYELGLKQQELAQNPVFAVNPKTGLRELTTVADAKANGFTNPTKVSQSDVEKESQLNSQVNDMQLNLSRYRASLNAMSNLTAADRAAMTHILSDVSVNNLLLQGAGFPAVISMAEQSGKGRDWNALSPDKQDALIGFLRMKNTGLLAQKVLTGMGRASKEALDIELANMPSPIEGATVGNKKLDAWQQNVDQMASRTVKLPWMEQSSDVKSRIEAQATQQYNQTQAGKPQGQYKSANPVQVGQNIQIRNVPGLSRVKKVYPDGTFDADQKP